MLEKNSPLYANSLLSENSVRFYFYRFKLWSDKIAPKGKPHVDIWDPALEFCSYIPFSLMIKSTAQPSTF